MTTLQACLYRQRRTLLLWLHKPWLGVFLRLCVSFLAGLVLSAASLLHMPMPLPLGLLCVLPPGPGMMLAALGAASGYVLFWGEAGIIGLGWAAAGLLTGGLLSQRGITRRVPLLLPSLAALLVAALGLAAQRMWQDETTVAVYLLQILLASGSALVFATVLADRGTPADWLAAGLAVLALAQLTPSVWVNPGFLVAGALASGGVLPAAALAGLALELAHAAALPMTAVLCLAFLVRLIPGVPRWVQACAPGILYLPVAALCGVWEYTPLPMLLLGGIVGTLLPGRSAIPHRRGEIGIAQVRLELASEVLAHVEQVILTAGAPPIDEAALIRLAAERACAGCSCRNDCTQREQMAALPASLLRDTRPETEMLPERCRKTGRIVQELRRSQAQLRALRGEQNRLAECRAALGQQYLFLASFLRELSDDLTRLGKNGEAHYAPEIGAAGAGRQWENGDCCLRFPGTGSRYYVLLCDGMGTGMGASAESRHAAELLRRLLTAGFPPEHALKSLNSLCVLRGLGGCVTADLAELRLDSGRVSMYKWGGAPSYLLDSAGIHKIGTAGPPPGLSVTQTRETVDRLSLRRGEALVLVSDGVGGEDAIRRAGVAPDASPGELAAQILECRDAAISDDAFVAVIRMNRLAPGA